MQDARSPKAASAFSYALVFARDLTRVAAFYEGVFGFLPQGSDPKFVRLTAPSGGAGIAVHLIPPDVPGSVATPPEWREDSAIKLCFSVPDVAEARARIDRFGGASREPWTWEQRLYCECIDPEGNRLQVIGPQP